MLTLINGNKQEYTIDLPAIVIMGMWNDVALAHLKENTGLEFEEWVWPGGYKAQPTDSSQIAALLVTYNFKTRYYNNATIKNTLYLKSDRHIGFDVDDICYDCAARNLVHVSDLKPGDILAC